VCLPLANLGASLIYASKTDTYQSEASTL
jgi:hypothetical protein